MADDRSDATLPDTVAATTEPAPRISDVGIDRRYDLGPLLGRGGMGEVRLARDLRIHRDVAVKLMHSATADPTLAARFLREAQVQGALEHPAIPPVHDLGIDRDGQPYFVMKKLAGTTLGEVLETRASAQVQAKWPRRALLARLVDVCLAVEFAHAAGVVHRDLKPANIMLGDFGETYVLDWGLARITDEQLGSIGGVSGEYVVGQTVAGAMLGTPGYMAPEQARGDAIDARADVYALGCVLYEILTGVPALPRGLPGIEATLAAAEHRPSKSHHGARAEAVGGRPDARERDAVTIPPELDDLCARATAQDRTKRPTARRLAEGIQAYLDGDRDLEARRTLALEHMRHALQRLGRPGDEARAEAMRDASRALALDPTNTAAQQLVARLVLEPPATPPPAAIEQADRERSRSRQKVLRWAAATYSSLVGFLAVLFAFPVRHPEPIVVTMGILAVMAGLFWYLSKKLLAMRTPWYGVILGLNTLAMTAAAFIFGPMFLLPVFAVGSLAGFVMAPSGYSPVWIVGAHVVAFLVPIAVEWLGIAPSTFGVESGRLVLTPWAVELTPIGAAIILIVGVLAQFANTTMIGLSERHSQDQALNRVHVQSWHLQQLVPAEPSDATDERA